MNVEHTILVGYVADLPTKSEARREVERLRLTEKINHPTLRGGTPLFRQIAEHFIEHELRNPDVIQPKADTTQYCYEHVIRAYLIERWGNVPATEIRPADMENWLKALSIDRDPVSCLMPAQLSLAKNRNPKDYPERAKVVSFQRQPCARQVGAITRICHVIGFQLDGQAFTASCFRCDPLLPGETYPARLDRKNLVLYVIHQKSNGSWGQDDYAIIDLTSEPAAKPYKK